MFQNLANYFLGGTTTTNNGAVGGVDDNDNRNNRVALRTTDHDDGWTMVDRDSEGNSEDYSSEEEDNVSESGLKRVRLQRTNSDDSLTRVQAHDMEESWFVTPPPCFTSQTGPVQLRTSPLENLLIEHPSMSVYQRTGSRHPHLTSPTPSEAAEDEMEIQVVDSQPQSEIVAIRPRSIRILVPNTYRCNSTTQLRQLQEMQVVRSRQAQKVQLKKQAQQATRGYLNRTNKAREANGRNWNPRRKERSQGTNRSHANNNRKC